MGEWYASSFPYEPIIKKGMEKEETPEEQADRRADAESYSFKFIFSRHKKGTASVQAFSTS
ncbi:hypothetical protein GCM10010954_32960 [Halobacillus andaensis]|uniref:Uncharacterized protein n=1 Tax=Halobacillus andaensis TaxID=1176239 RepID=A0A917BAJ2_HALAA|nr:hypothetical protein [Halobacillus andaensis]GGF31183.1 hypothetical protein GCM10010954_32960 [Halobacillus andaensis]